MSPRGAARLATDRQQVISHYPALSFVTDKRTGVVTIEGTVTLLTATSGVPTRIALRIVLPNTYPQSEPRAYETGRRFEWGNLAGHVLSDGRLCLWLDARSPWAGHDPAAGWDRRDTEALLRFVEQVVVFCERYLVWEAGGKKSWPGGESAHGGVGHVEYIHEALGVEIESLEKFGAGFGAEDGLEPYAACPCGSGKKYRFCHRVLVHELRRRCNGRVLTQDFAQWIASQRL